MTDNMFERAAKLSLRFESGKGQLAVEDLYDLSLESLDNLAKKVNKALRDEGEESFIPNKTTRAAATHNALRLDLLKHVIEVKVKEQDARRARAETVATLDRLKNLAATKADEQLASKGLEEIAQQIKQLEASLA